jgi:aspartyl-tRNA(Asn)/glutamyl-tRNA(Gln) amidotransferase subunit C
MSLTRDDVKKVARLSRLRMDDQQLDALLPKMNTIVGFIEQLAEVDTDNVEPLSNVARSTLPLRADVINDGECRDAVLANAPESEEGFFAVPKVVE